MTAFNVGAKRKDDTAETLASYDVGDNLDEMVAKFGADVVYQKAKGSIIINLQSVIRSWLSADPTKRGELQSIVSAWKPDARTIGVKKSADEKAREAVASMTPEQRKEFLAQLRAMI